MPLAVPRRPRRPSLARREKDSTRALAGLARALGPTSSTKPASRSPRSPSTSVFSKRRASSPARSSGPGSVIPSIPWRSSRYASFWRPPSPSSGPGLLGGVSLARRNAPGGDDGNHEGSSGSPLTLPSPPRGEGDVATKIAVVSTDRPRTAVRNNGKLRWCVPAAPSTASSAALPTRLIQRSSGRRDDLRGAAQGLQAPGESQ